jgi:hypothetical protein
LLLLPNAGVLSVVNDRLAIFAERTAVVTF